MALNRRQARLYSDSCDIWRWNKPNRGSAETYTLIASDVKYHHEWSPSTSDVFAVGRQERDIILTMDRAHFDAEQEINDKYVFVMKTVDNYGNNVSAYGQGWAVRGNPQENRSRGGRNANKKMVFCVVLNALPTGVTA